MSKVYDPILCMLVDKKSSKARDGKIRYAEIISDIKLIRTNRDWEEANEKINMYARGGFITEQEKRDLREKLNAKRIKGVNDASPSGYSLFVNGKVVKVFWAIGAPVKEAQIWMKENMPGKVGTLTGNRSGAKYSITAKDSTVDRAIRAIDKSAMTVKVIGTNWETGKKVEFYEDVRTDKLPVAQRIIEKRYKDLKVISVTKAHDAANEKGYELDGFWIKPNDYGVEVTKNGKKVGEFDSTSEAEKWIRGKYGD